MKNTVTAGLCASAAVIALLSGCSKAAKLEGGDMSCKDFLAAQESDQQSAVSKMLKDEKGSEPAQLNVTASRAAVQAFCQTAGKSDSKIKDAPHA